MSKTDKGEFEAVIGLEVHVRLGLKSKLFCSDANQYGREPNTLASEIALGYPGTLPVLNEKAIENAVKMGLACHSEVATTIVFDRKNYFYPDLPKGYQVTQDRMPICEGGEVRIKIGSAISVIALTRIHLEEDAGKSIHGSDNTSLIDYNRAGTALIEIVTEPVMQDAEEAYAFLHEIRRLVRYLEIGDANMEEGSLRCDANISIRPTGSSELGKKVEIKNMNSLNNVKKAINHEIRRQKEIVKSGNNVLSETRSFNPQTGNSSGMREKETLTDYRYFPEPDLSPVLLTEDWIKTIEERIPELPMDKELRYASEFSLNEYDASLLSRSKPTAIYFESIVSSCKNPKAAANWMMGPIATELKSSNGIISDFPIGPEQIAGIIADIDKGRYSYSYASKSIFPLLLKNPELTPEQVNQGNKDAGSDLQEIVKIVLNEFHKEAELYKQGNKKILEMLMGQVMRKSRGVADPKKAKEQLQNALNIP